MSTSLLSKEQIEDLLSFIGTDKVNSWKGDKISFCCPVHGESHPSAGINANFTPEGSGEVFQVFNCFSCGASGSIPRFLMLSMPDRFTSFVQAVKFLESRYNVDYSNHSHKKFSIGGNSIKRYEDDDIVYDRREVKPLTFIAPFKSGKETYKYFFKRGFTKEDMREYMIGRDVENRTVTIPVFWEDKKLAGVVGRFIDRDRPHNSRYKIYNFEKSKLVFPLDKLEVVDDTIIGVEAQFDAMMMRKWGIKNVVATMGGTISKSQANIIASRCSVFIPLFDNDEGGEKTTDKARRYLRKRVRVLDVTYPDEKFGKDPSEWGEEITKEVLKTAGKIQIPRL